MTARRALFTLLVAGLVLLAAGANPRTVAGERDSEHQVARQARVLSPAPGSLSSRVALTPPPCFRPGPLFDVHIGTPTIWLGDVAYNLLHDEYLLVWSMEQNTQTHEVWAARVGPDTTVRGTFKVAGAQGVYRDQPAVAYSPVQDEYLVAYNLSPFGSADVDVYAKRMSWDGVWKSSEFAIRNEPDQQWSPRVSYSEAHDEYLVVYWNRWVGGLEDIAAQRVRASDGALQSWRNLATGVNETRWSPDVAYNPARDEYLVVYDYFKGTTLETRSLRFDYSMGTVFSEITISDQTSGLSGPRVAAGPNEYLVLWSTYTSGIDRDVRGRRVSGHGIPQGASAGFNIAGAGITEGYSNPDVNYSEALGYLVAMEHQLSDMSTDVVARFVPPGHDSAAGELLPFFDFPALQNSPQVACSPQGHCLIAERDTWDPAELNRWAIRGLMLGVCPRVFLPLVVRST